MNVGFRFIIIVLFITVILAKTQTNEQFLVNYYVDLITSRNTAAETYQFPTDARMYEVRDKFPKGMYLF